MCHVTIGDRLPFSLFGFWVRAEPVSLLRQHKGGRHAHVPAALRHRLHAEGPVAGRAPLDESLKIYKA